MSFPKKFFVTGTDTGVGKSLVSAMLMIGLEADYWKPVQSGMDPETDTEWIKSVTKLSCNRFFKESYCLKEPLSPHASAQLEGIEIDLEKFTLPQSSRPLIIEGAGGVMVPLNQKECILDLILYLNLPVLIVARSALGTINHSLMTIHTLRRHQVPILGVVVNGPENFGNSEAIRKFGGVEILAEVKPLDRIDAQALADAFNKFFKKERRR